MCVCVCVCVCVVGGGGGGGGGSRYVCDNTLNCVYWHSVASIIIDSGTTLLVDC